MVASEASESAIGLACAIFAHRALSPSMSRPFESMDGGAPRPFSVYDIGLPKKKDKRRGAASDTDGSTDGSVYKKMQDRVTHVWIEPVYVTLDTTILIDQNVP